MIHRRTSIAFLAAAAALASAGLAHAQAPGIKVGITISATGPAASLGTAQKNTVDLLPRTLGGLPVTYVLLDDATDPTQAAKNARRFVESENVDVIIGSSTTPTSLAVAEVAHEAKVPQIGLAPYTAKQVQWTFSLPQTYSLMYSALFKELKKRNAKTIAYIGFSDALGDAALKEVERLAAETGIRLVASERYARTDQSVTAQALKIVQSQADAVVFGASGTAAALPLRALRQRGYKGGHFQNHGVANNDFLRVVGDAGEGMVSPTGLVLVAEQLPDSHPSKVVALNYLKAYEDKHGAGSRNPFGAYAQDAYLLLDAAVRKVGGKAAPGTPAFRGAVRDALEATRDVPVTHGVSTMSATDHSGLGEGAVALITIEKGTWKLLK